MTIGFVSGGTWRESTTNWDSRIDMHVAPDRWNCIPYNLEITVHIQAVPAGEYTYIETVDGDSPGTVVQRERTVQIAHHRQSDVDRYWEAFRDAIYRGWNDKLWLVDSSSSTGCHRGGIPPRPNLKCGVQLTRAPLEEAQLRVQLLYKPTRNGSSNTGWRSHCALGGRSQHRFRIGPNPVDMVVAHHDQGSDTELTTSRQLTTRGTTQREEPYEQCTAAHEFGHYIGLHHSCARDGGLNSSAQYCIGGSAWWLRSMMAAGHEIRRRHAYAWRQRLYRHEYAPRTTAWQGQPRLPTLVSEDADRSRRCTE